MNQNHLIEEILKVNSNTIIVLNTGSPIRMPWADKASTILQTWFAGQEFGNALTDILTGATNPSGKLPTSFPKELEDTPAFKCYPGDDLQMNYDERRLVGYKWYERKNIKPLFTFGHGLSYTQFKYSDLNVNVNEDNAVMCTFFIQNIGEVIGSETMQCYVSYVEEDLSEPLKTLQGFQKNELEVGQKNQIEISLSSRNFATWNVDTKDWQVRPGVYEISIGSSAEDIHLQTTINL